MGEIVHGFDEIVVGKGAVGRERIVLNAQEDFQPALILLPERQYRFLIGLFLLRRHGGGIIGGGAVAGKAQGYELQCESCLGHGLGRVGAVAEDGVGVDTGVEELTHSKIPPFRLLHLRHLCRSHKKAGNFSTWIQILQGLFSFRSPGVQEFLRHLKYDNAIRR